MKIEKGKLYYHTALGKLEKSEHSSEIKDGLLTDKIAVHCPTKDDWEYVDSKLGIKSGYCEQFNYKRLDNDNYWFGLDKINSEYLEYNIITIDQFKEFYPEDNSDEQEDYDDPYNWVVNGMKDESEVFNPKPYYDNSKGSLYKVATGRGWNPYLFDVVKRLERGGKKDPLRQEIEKSIDVLKIWLNEID